MIVWTAEDGTLRAAYDESDWKELAMSEAGNIFDECQECGYNDRLDFDVTTNRWLCKTCAMQGPILGDVPTVEIEPSKSIRPTGTQDIVRTIEVDGKLYLWCYYHGYDLSGCHHKGRKF